MSTRIGLGFGVFPFSDVKAFWRWIDYCDESEIDSIWLSERLVGTPPQLEPLTALAAIAGRTRRLKFGMNTTVLPLRDPLVLAKECATIDYLSDGRFLPMFGVGNDLAPEWPATSFDTRGRGQRANEMLAMLRIPQSPAADHVAAIGDNIKTLIFPLAELPQMGRGKGVKLQNFKQGGLADVAVFNAEAGPEWVDGGGRRRNWPDWKDWLGKRAGAGRQGPRGLRKFR